MILSRGNKGGTYLIPRFGRGETIYKSGIGVLTQFLRCKLQYVCYGFIVVRPLFFTHNHRRFQMAKVK